MHIPAVIPQSHNVILYGESGCGKSSIINMLLREDVAPTSSAAVGCTGNSTPYPCNIKSRSFILWDTCGLNEGEHGTVDDIESMAKLYRLLKKLKDGVSLLVFCMQGNRINAAARQNWKLVREIICQKQVPIVIAVTHLEKEDNMDDWWATNERRLREYEMNPSRKDGSTGVACITAVKGKMKKGGYVYQEEYDASRAKMEDLIVNNCLHDAWKVPPVQWFKEVVTTTYVSEWCGLKTKEVQGKKKVEGPGIYEIISRCEVPKERALEIALALESDGR